MDVQEGAAYSDAVFNVATINEAKRIILTPEGATTTDQRWQKETPYLLSLIEQFLNLDESSVVLDFGCGVGRMAKAMIDRFGCRVVGADTSASMRALAAAYVVSPRFLVCAPEALPWLGIKFDAALTVWVLQHCFDPDSDLDLIQNALVPGGRLFVVNDRRRLVPTVKRGWATDGKDVCDLTKQKFAGGDPQPLDPVSIGQKIADASYWAKAWKG